MDFHDPQVGVSCDDAAKAGPALCSLRDPEVLPSGSMGPQILVGAPDFYKPHAVSLQWWPHEEAASSPM